MQFVVTTLGESVLRSSGSNPPTLGAFKLADGAPNYLPSPTQPDVLGTVVFTGVPSAPSIQSANLLRYTVVVEGLTSNLSFNETGLYLPDGSLFAVGVQNPKYTISGNPNKPRGASIDCYISIDDDEAFLFAETGNQEGSLNAQARGSVDLLPPAVSARPNLVLVPNPVEPGTQSTVASSNNSLWSLSTHTEVVFEGLVQASASLWVRSQDPAPAPSYTGEMILQFTAGANHGICRLVTSYDSLTNTYNIQTPLAVLPAEGDSFIVLRATALRSETAALLAGLSPLLTADMLNSLVDFPLEEFFKKDGSTPMTGHLDAGGNRIINLSNPIAVSDGANKSYVDLNSGGGGGGGINIEDYLSDSNPFSVGESPDSGSVGLASRADHVHAHGDLPGGSLHADATTSVSGFMSATDKQNLDNCVTGLQNAIKTYQFSVPALTWTVTHGLNSVNFAFFIYATDGSQHLAPVTILDSNSFQIEFSELKSGRVVVMFDLDSVIVVS